ncbi:sterol C-14 reductase [Capsaspora owczarzaki ATCC 30864]|uniref:Delta(14)-sterol reductase n=1 Tax=Capsaspora owczarzaki (strain ATCC 30864) TaxID=595528 RepID=A0A0D2WWN2_CAPO3|nr:sterol C-14 reductase [Capsaspora owczarzaki ATCC 30864]KJE97405.1 sterol C-14 reductase [Capsaspora owczarzaki ATCC 30864]|eukprot:XP_004343132.1 sterol C-14 reductase [Capsaspora owczarzaki ATCC 30864]
MARLRVPDSDSSTRSGRSATPANATAASDAASGTPATPSKRGAASKSPARRSRSPSRSRSRSPSRSRSRSPSRKSTKTVAAATTTAAAAASPAKSSRSTRAKQLVDKNGEAITTTYEWGGPIGAGFLIPFVPFVAAALPVLCSQDYCLEWKTILTPAVLWAQLCEQFGKQELSDWVSLKAFAVYVAWFLFQVALYLYIPTRKALGVPLKDGKRLEYPLNGLAALVVSVVVALSLQVNFPVLEFLYENFKQLLAASVIFSTLLSIYLFVSAEIKGTGFALGGNSKNPIYDFWIGRELNPRIGSLDLKYFCELRPGLSLWMLLNIAFVYHQHSLQGGFTAQSVTLILVSLFHAYYIIDALLNEESILTTMDITSDGFGFMLAFGDLVWVPFTFVSSSRYLALYPNTLHPIHIAIVLAFKFTGLYLFRGANSQKDTFRRDPTHPSVSHLKTLTTSTGRKLLISGFWGMARHINYFGDWLMAAAWCLPAGFVHVVPYFYLMYFIPLLLHRERRDDEHCLHKYGKDWIKYRDIVKSRIIPGVY